MNTTKYRVFLALAIFFIVMAAILFYMNLRLWSAIAALLGISFFYFNSYEGFTTRNSVTYTTQSITVKLVGRKTFGFTFKEIEKLDLSEKGLYIKSRKMDAVTLSRKRYKKESIDQLYNILLEKSTTNERR